MKPFKLSLALAAFAGLLLFAGCADEHAAIDADANSLAVVFAPELAGHTLASRAIDQTWSATDLIGICRIAHEGALPTGSAFGKYKISGAAGTSVSLVPNAADQTIYYPVNGDKVNFIAFSPYSTDATVQDNTVQYTTFANQSTPADMEAVDFLYHKGTTAYDRTATSPVALTFKHLLSRVTINVQTTTGADKIVDLSALTLTLAGTPGSVTAALADGKLTAGSTAATIAPYHKSFTASDATRTATAIVVPNKNVSGRVITFTVAGAGAEGANLVFTYTLPAARAFDSGYAYTLNFTLTTGGIDVGTSSTEVWEEGTVNWEGKYMLDAPAELPLAWYPESKILAFSTNYTDEDGSDIEVVLSTSATDADEGVPTWITLGDSPLAATAKDSYTAYTYTFAPGMNESTSDTRTAYAHIKAGATTLKVVELEQQPLVPEAASNCYILAPGEAIAIPVSRANEHTTEVGADPAIDTNTEFTAELLWADAANLLAADPAVYGTGGKGYIVVEASSATLVGDGGNAIIAVKVGDDDIVWSWHIWVCADAPANKGGWLDRNLGALSGKATDGVKTFGLYYQWGRKDPFPGSPNNTVGNTDEPTLYNASGDPFTYAIQTEELSDLGVATLIETEQTLSWTVANPFTFIGYGASWMSGSTNTDNNWGYTGSKTIYDPCPEGYRVPINGSWGVEADWSAFTWDSTNKGRDTGTTYGGWYPAAGRRTNAAGALNSVGAYGCAWAASPNSAAFGVCLDFSPVTIVPVGLNYRSYGCGVRCLLEDPGL